MGIIADSTLYDKALLAKAVEAFHLEAEKQGLTAKEEKLLKNRILNRCKTEKHQEAIQMFRAALSSGEVRQYKIDCIRVTYCIFPENTEQAQVFLESVILWESLSTSRGSDLLSFLRDRGVGFLVCSGKSDPAPVEQVTQGEHQAFDWKDVKIALTSNETLKIEIPNRPVQRLTFGEAGFSDKRKGVPNTRWNLLLYLAVAGEVIPSKYLDFQTKKPIDVKMGIADIRKELEQRIGIEDCPILYNRRSGSYQVGFALTDERFGGKGASNSGQSDARNPIP